MIRLPFLFCYDGITSKISVNYVFNSQPFDHSHKVAKFCYADKVIGFIHYFILKHCKSIQTPDALEILGPQHPNLKHESFSLDCAGYNRALIRISIPMLSHDCANANS